MWETVVAGWSFDSTVIGVLVVFVMVRTRRKMRWGTAEKKNSREEEGCVAEQGVAAGERG
ncbi:hypothetical protein HanIR_Chr16g0818741 [Helianthus annuus]|nr:hypothetical protein HanIR_Chr16g0818741 [Helianthus annuus]